MKKILALTSIRSDYDLMSGLYRLLDNDPDFELKLLVSGAHMSPLYGRSVELIRRDGFEVLQEIDSLDPEDTQRSRLRTAANLLQGSIDVVDNWRPDLIIYAGDREDVLIGAMLGAFLNIPTLHFFGGDHSKDGHTDTVIRHATSKLSTCHAVSTELHRQRLISMGEPARRICVTGSVALDRFVHQTRASAIDATSLLPQHKALTGYAMLIFHPVDDEQKQAGEIFATILSSLKRVGIPAIVSYPNSDPGNHAIIAKIQDWCDEPGFWFYKNLDRETFLALYRQARFLIGNSSSGILEAASLRLGVINVGLRQTGRLCGDNVIFCNTDATSIDAAVSQVLSAGFQARLAGITNPYGEGNSCQRALEYIRQTDFKAMLKKTEDPLDRIQSQPTLTKSS